MVMFSLCWTIGAFFFRAMRLIFILRQETNALRRDLDAAHEFMEEERLIATNRLNNMRHDSSMSSMTSHPQGGGYCNNGFTQNSSGDGAHFDSAYHDGAYNDGANGHSDDGYNCGSGHAAAHGLQQNSSAPVCRQQSGHDQAGVHGYAAAAIIDVPAEIAITPADWDEPAHTNFKM